MNADRRPQYRRLTAVIAGVCAGAALAPHVLGAAAPGVGSEPRAGTAAAIGYDVKNSEYRLSLGRQTVRIFCRSGRFTAGDVPGVQDRLGVAVDARNLKLDGTSIAGQVAICSQDRPVYQLEATVSGGQVTGTYVDGKGAKGQVTGRLSFPIASQESIAWFETARLGIGMHWSISSVRYCSNSPSWDMQSKKCTKEQYEAQMKEFKAQNFDPAAWAKLFKEAGAQYFIPYVKHHDGFCMWDTATTEYRITHPSCPFHAHPRADIV